MMCMSKLLRDWAAVVEVSFQGGSHLNTSQLQNVKAYISLHAHVYIYHEQFNFPLCYFMARQEKLVYPKELQARFKGNEESPCNLESYLTCGLCRYARRPSEVCVSQYIAQIETLNKCMKGLQPLAIRHQ
jgi:hypothetical protein